MKSLLSILAIGFAVAVNAGQPVTLEWTNIDAPDCALYRIYYGTNAGAHFGSNVVTAVVGQATQRTTVTNLDAGRLYFFAADAVLSNGTASPKSAEISYVVPVPPPTAIRVISTLQAANAVEGPWTNLATLNEQVIPLPVTDQTRFYRSLVSVTTELPPNATPSALK